MYVFKYICIVCICTYENMYVQKINWNLQNGVDFLKLSMMLISMKCGLFEIGVIFEAVDICYR